MRKRRKPSSAAEAEMRRLFKDPPKQRLPMAPDPVPPKPARSHADAQAMLARVMLRVGRRHGDDAMKDAAVRLAKVAKTKS